MSDNYTGNSNLDSKSSDGLGLLLMITVTVIWAIPLVIGSFAALS